MVRLLVKATFKDYLAALEGAGGGVKNTLVLASAEPGMNGDLLGNNRQPAAEEDAATEEEPREGQVGPGTLDASGVVER